MLINPLSHTGFLLQLNYLNHFCYFEFLLEFVTTRVTQLDKWKVTDNYGPSTSIFEIAFMDGPVVGSLSSGYFCLLLANLFLEVLGNPHSLLAGNIVVLLGRCPALWLLTIGHHRIAL